MKHLKSNVQTIKSNVEYDYLTLKVTQSRINKGLLAIPVSLLDIFPKKKGKIKIYFDENTEFEEISFTPYTSSSRECRIGGMKRWFHLHKLRDGDEIVLQISESGNFCYRILTENYYVTTIKDIQNKIDNSNDDIETENNIHLLTRITNFKTNKVIENEFIRLSKEEITKRKYVNKRIAKSKENVPASIRKILKEIYKGKCQLTSFTFLQKNDEPYFEIHHIDENKGNFLKNLLAVSPNTHAQFTYAKKEEFFDESGWLRKVKFNEKEYIVNQHIYQIQRNEFIKEIHF